MREISLHVLDLLMNSVEAGASRVLLVVHERPADDWLDIYVRDNGPGMDAEALARAADPFFTTRTTRRVGLGIPLLAAACERAGGGLAVRSRAGAGVVIRARFHICHIDRAPLGKMGGVVQCLATEASRVRFRYCHKTPLGVFIIDTEELQQELEEVRLDEPSVLRWLSDYVNRGLVDLSSQA